MRYFYKFDQFIDLKPGGEINLIAKAIAISLTALFLVPMLSIGAFSSTISNCNYPHPTIAAKLGKNFEVAYNFLSTGSQHDHKIIVYDLFFVDLRHFPNGLPLPKMLFWDNQWIKPSISIGWASIYIAGNNFLYVFCAE